MVKRFSNIKLSMPYIMSLLFLGFLGTVGISIQYRAISEAAAVQELVYLISEQRVHVKNIALIYEKISDQEARNKEIERLEQELIESANRLRLSIKQTEQLLRSRKLKGTANNLRKQYLDHPDALINNLSEIVDVIARDFRGMLSSEQRDIKYILSRISIDELATELATLAAFARSRSRARVEFLNQVEWGVYSSLMLALVGIGFFVFRPYVRSIKENQEELINANINLQQKTSEAIEAREQHKSQSRVVKSILDNLSEAIIVVNNESIIEVYNPSAQKLFGPVKEATEFQEWKATLQLLSINGSKSAPFRFLPLQSSEPFSAWFRCQDGVRRKFVVISQTVEDEYGIGHDTLFSFQDVTELTELAEQFKENAKEAQKANRMKTQFIANMSHEIRTPMGAILGYTDRLLDSNLRDDQRIESINIIRRNGKVLLNLIDDLLDISRVESGNLKVEKVWMQLSKVISEVRFLLEARAREKLVDLKIETSKVLPEKIKSDPLRLRQILVNIVGNALKFTEKGTVLIQVNATEGGSREEAMLRVTVKDTGCGIPESAVENLFKPFVQADASTTRKYGGSGLGLVLSKHLAKKLGGDVRLVESKLNQGSTFEFSLPIPEAYDIEWKQLDVQDMSIQVLKNVDSIFPKTGLEDYRILVVEDSKENRELFKLYLTKAGAKVEVANDGKEGAHKALNYSYDLILMDIQMPIMDGYESVKIIKNSDLKTPIVALTAHALREEVERCRRAGFDGHLAKPITAQSLVQAAITYINSYCISLLDTEQSNKNRYMSSSQNISIPEEAIPLLRKFVSTLPTRSMELKKAVKEQNIENLEKMAHKLKGTAGAFGLSELMEEMANIEDGARSNSISNEKVLNKLDNLMSFVPPQYWPE